MPEKQACMFGHEKVGTYTNSENLCLHINCVDLFFPSILPSTKIPPLSRFLFAGLQKSYPRSAVLPLPKSEQGSVSRNGVSLSLVGEETGSRGAGLPIKCPLEPGCSGQPRPGFRKCLGRCSLVCGSSASPREGGGRPRGQPAMSRY